MHLTSKRLKMKRLNINRLLLAALVGLCALGVRAQNSSTIERQMDDVKLSEEFIYGYMESDDKNIAYDDALQDLLMSVNDYRLEKDKEASRLTVSDIQPCAKELAYAEADVHYVLVYLTRRQALSLTRKSHEGVVPTLPGSRPKPEVRKDSLAPAKPQPPVTPVAPKESKEPKAAPAAQLPDDVVATITGQDTWLEVKGLLTEYKRRGQVKETGVVTKAVEAPADAYVILIDELSGILAFLSPNGGSGRINNRTFQPDSESNYTNCKVIVWYK